MEALLDFATGYRRHSPAEKTNLRALHQTLRKKGVSHEEALKGP